MKSNLTKVLRHLISTGKVADQHAAEALDLIASDLASKKQKVSEHHEKAANAINTGTRIAKRRIPL